MRGIGAYHRLRLYRVKEYSELGYADLTGPRLSSDHNTTVRLLDCEKRELAT